jgi:nucleoid DNA-binding protein
MNNSELIKKISFNSKLSQKDCKLCLEAFKEVIKDSLKKGEKVYFSNLEALKLEFIILKLL